MKCFVCGKTGYFKFCGSHAPEHGKLYINSNTVISYGKTRLKIIWYFVRCYKIVRWWTGTDARTLVEFPPGKKVWYVRIVLHRVYEALMQWFVHENWVGCPQVFNELDKFGIKTSHYFEYPPRIQHKVKKAENRRWGHNILVQTPPRSSNDKYKNWVYGVDIIEGLRSSLNGQRITIVEANGSKDMLDVYPYIDAYINTKRYANGVGRIMLECDINDIPYYYNTDGKPKVKEIIDFLMKEKIL